MIKYYGLKKYFCVYKVIYINRLLINSNLTKIRIIPLIVLLCSFSSFAQKKNTWMRRNWTNMVAHYNIYYHGEKLFTETIQDLITLHKDDFTKPIEVYPYSDEATANSLKPKMENLLKKTSLIINKKSKSKWVDDCWLLTGKAHFLRGDLLSADENFQFVNSQYSDRPIRYEAKLWILKTLVRDGKVNDAEAIFKTFQREEKFPKAIQYDLYNVAGDIYTKMGLYSEAQKYLELGVAQTNDRVLSYRIHFLLAQLYVITNDFDKARLHYRKVTRMNAPYEFAFQSNVGIVKVNTLAGKTDTRESRRNLKKMLKDDKNIDYFDQLYFELGNLDFADNHFLKAIKNYQMSALKASKNQDLKTNAYLKIAKIYYETKDYKLAEKYFDSTALFITEKHPEYEKIKLQQSILSTLINHLITIYTQDSLLRLSTLPKDKLEAEIKRTIEKENEIKTKALKNEEDNNLAIPVQPTLNTPSSFTGTDQFIFDNQALLGKEYNEFLKRWGNRKHTDNWRIANLKKELTADPLNIESNNEPSADKPDGDITKTDQSIPDLKKHLLAIPFSTKDKELAHKKIIEAHMEAGKIYLDKLKEYKTALHYFETLLKRYPSNIYEAELLYYLTKCCDALKDSSTKNEYAKQLAKKYPESPYNKVTTSKTSIKTDASHSNTKNEKQEVISAYEKMYDAFIGGQYLEVKKIKEQMDSKYAGNAIQAKFDYLYALAIAKTDGKEKYIDLLKQIKDNYAGTEIADKAKYTLEILENKEKIASIYKYNGSQPHFFGVVTEEGQSERIKTAISNFNTKYYGTSTLKIKSFLLGNKDMLGVELFDNKSDAMKYYAMFLAHFNEFVPELNPSFKYFAVSSDNLKSLLREMELLGYLEFFEKMYL